MNSHLIPLAAIFLDVLLEARALGEMEAASMAFYWKKSGFFRSEFDVHCWMPEKMVKDELQFSEEVAFWVWTVVF